MVCTEIFGSFVPWSRNSGMVTQLKTFIWVKDTQEERNKASAPSRCSGEMLFLFVGQVRLWCRLKSCLMIVWSQWWWLLYLALALSFHLWTCDADKDVWLWGYDQTICPEFMHNSAYSMDHGRYQGNGASSIMGDTNIDIFLKGGARMSIVHAADRPDVLIIA